MYTYTYIYNKGAFICHLGDEELEVGRLQLEPLALLQKDTRDRVKRALQLLTTRGLNQYQYK